MKQITLYLFLLLFLPASVSAQTEGWDNASERQVWGDDIVYFSIDWVETAADGTEKRTEFRLGDKREMKVETDWADFSKNFGQTTSQLEANQTPALYQARGVNGAQFVWYRDKYTITSKVTLSGSEQINRWVALEPNKCTVEYKGKKHAFNVNVPQVSSEEFVAPCQYSSEEFMQPGRYVSVLSYKMNDNIKKIPAFGTILKPGISLFPDEWGEITDAKQTVANNETHDSYDYTWCLYFSNGYVLPVVIRKGATNPEWNLSYVEKTNVTTYNGGTYQPSTKTWVNSTATDETDQMVWTREGTVLATKTKESAVNCRWDEGNISVHTNRHELTIDKGIIRSTDTYTGNFMGAWSSYREYIPAFNVKVTVGEGGLYVDHNNFFVYNSHSFQIEESKKATRMGFVIAKLPGYRLKSVTRNGYDATSYVERNASFDCDVLVFENLACDTELEFEFEELENQEIIQFADEKVKAICIESWDTDHDGELSKGEAKAVNELGSVFQGKDITVFHELQFFNRLTSIGNSAFQGCTSLSSLTIPNSVTSIGNSAFANCNSLTSLNIPNSVTSIGSYAFYHCSGLTSITIPHNVTTIGYAAFMGCNNLTTISIGYGMKSIGNYAFANCTELTDVYCYAEKVPSTGSDPFFITEYTTLHVPAASISLYKAKAPWKYFFNIVSLQIDGEQPADEVTLTANNYSRAYGEANPTFGYTVTEGTITSGTPTISCEATATSPVGTYDIVIAKGTVSNKTVSLVKGTLTITKAPLTVSAGNYTKVEGEDNPVFTPTYSGFKNDETAAVLTKQPTITTTATKTSTAGTYPVTVSGAEAQNYSFNYQNGTLTVTSQSVVQKDNIQFADAKVKAICVANWDTDYDGELSKQEAVAVTSIGTVFSEEWEITSFDELQYFTGLTAIDDNAFAGCDGLTSITLPNTITSLGTYAFSGCDGLTSFVIPSSVTTLNDAVFNYCVGLTAIIIPKSVTRMGFNPLNGCSALTSIQVESGNPNFDSRNGCNAIIYGKSDILVSGCKNTVIPDGIKTIWQYAFGGCEELTSITIPASVTSFGNYAFFGCDNLEEIHSEIVQPSAINATVFGNTDIFTTATLYVPAGTKAQYQATDGWKNFRNIVEQGGTATDIASATITIENTSYPYTGSAIEPAVSVVYSGTTLVKGTDYSLSYKNNIMAGTATVTATGVGNYTGTVTATFTIDKAQLVVTAQSIMREYGEENPGFTCKISGFMNEDTVLDLTKLPVITTTASTMSPVGTYDITVSGGEARNYSFNYEAGTLTIVPKGIATATLTVADSCVYTGQPIWPDVTVQLDGRVLTEGTDYSLTFTNNFMPGIASLTIMGVGNYTGTVTKTFVIFTPTAIGDVDADATKFDVYDMSGRKIRRHVTNIEGLPKGVYIIGGRKRAVK